MGILEKKGNSYKGKGVNLMSRKLSHYIMILCLFALPLYGNPPMVKAEVFDILQKVGMFNPMSNVLDPIHQAIPRLRLRGFIRNQTWVYTEGKTGATATHRERKNDFDQIEWLGELEFHYRLSNKISLGGVTNFRYDAVYDWEPKDGLGKGGGQIRDLEKEYYYTTKQILRELYADIYAGDWYFRIGKQQIVLGKMDFRVVDIINPTIRWQGPAEVVDNYEFLRIPTWMVNALWTKGTFNFRTIWIPDFEENQGLVPGMGEYPFPYNPLVDDHRPYRLDKPPQNPANSEIAFMLDWFTPIEWGKLGSWELSYGYFYNWNDNPTVFQRTLKLHQSPEARFTRLNQHMVGIVRSFWWLDRGWDFRLENLFTQNLYVPTRGELDPYRSGYLLPGRDGVTRINTNFLAFYLNTYIHKDWTVMAIFANIHAFKYDESDMMPLKRDETFIVLSIRHPFEYFDDRLTLYNTYYNHFTQGQGKNRIGLKFTLGDYMSLNVEYYAFWGHSDDSMGRWDKWDIFKFNMSYEF
jgi:hypothetical protein